MKLTGYIAIILTLIALLLLLVAAFVFLYDGRQTLEGQRDDLTTQAADLQGQLDVVNPAFQAAVATRTMVEGDLATAVNDTVLLEEQLVGSQQEVDGLTSQVEGLTGDLAAASATQTALEAALTAVNEQPPQVEIIQPETNMAVPLAESVEIVFVATDPVGIAAVNLTADGETIKTYTPGDATLFTASETWTPESEGRVEIGVVAINSNGRAADLVTVTIVVTTTVSQNSSSSTAVPETDPSAALRAEIEANVIAIRSLTPTSAVTTTLLTGEELRQRVETDLLEDFTKEEAQKQSLTLQAFDFLPPGFDLFTFSRDIYSEQIAGFYDPETDEFVVVSEDDVLGANEQLTHAHEYVHALQDQHFTLDMLDDDGRNADAQLAFTSLAEGEATLVQTLYMLQGHIDLVEVLAEAGNLETPVLDSAPPFMVHSLLFPYEAGLEFVRVLWGQDDFSGIDAAWENIPQSSEQILHPARYLADDAPQLVMLPPLTDTLGAGWALMDEDVLGEFMLREYLSQQLLPEQVDTAAIGWGGDRYAVYANEAEGTTLLALRLVWDTDEDATEFAALYPNYPAAVLQTSSQLQGDGGECWSGVGDVICLFQSGRETLIIRAPDLAVGTTVAAVVNN
ncbi:MAG: hypothetical protein GY796_27125 [Chloroflexi bacterium]|nr:hypothetical protein [Chloroflexota bacterium]